MIDQYITFLLKHWPLTLLFILTAAAIALHEWLIRTLGIKSLSPQEVVQLINKQNGIIVDIRDQKSFNQEHIIHAINILSSNLEEELKNILHHQNKPIIVVGDSEQSTNEIAIKISKSGFQSVQTMAGGLKAWQASGLPLEKD